MGDVGGNGGRWCKCHIAEGGVEEEGRGGEGLCGLIARYFQASEGGEKGLRITWLG